ncbi:MAG: SulP family inorganic anion transporter, partial [Candidatus Binatia bacterium]
GGATPMEIGLSLAFMVGVTQFVAGLLRLDVLVDYISNSVLLGYVSGAAVLIAVGQLPNATGTPSGSGNLLERLEGWIDGLGGVDLAAAALAAGTIVAVIGLRRLDPRIPAAILAMAGGTIVSAALGLRDRGLAVVADIVPIVSGFPPLTLPDFERMPSLLSAALACTVLSLVESSSVARALASRRGDRLHMRTEFTGQGLANLAAGFSGGYPIGGSLSRSVLNERAGAETRLAGALSGLLMLLVLLVLAPLVNHTPLASLAGLLLVVAFDLIDLPRIRTTIRGTLADRLGFSATLLGTWSLPLDQAIYVGVIISIVLFLRRARLLSMRELAISGSGGFREIEPELGEVGRRCSAIRIMNLTGQLFFAVAGELDTALDRLLRDRRLRILMLRMRQVETLDVTTAAVLVAAAERLGADDRRMLLIGVRAPILAFLERTRIAERVGPENVFPIDAGGRFSAMEPALRRALDLVGDHDCGESCPLREYVRRRRDPAPQTARDWSI